MLRAICCVQIRLIIFTAKERKESCKSSSHCTLILLTLDLIKVSISIVLTINVAIVEIGIASTDADGDADKTGEYDKQTTNGY